MMYRQIFARYLMTLKYFSGESVPLKAASCGIWSGLVYLWNLFWGCQTDFIGKFIGKVSLFSEFSCNRVCKFFMVHLLFKYPTFLGLPAYGGEQARGTRLMHWGAIYLEVTLGSNKMWIQVCGFECLFASASWHLLLWGSSAMSMLPSSFCLGCYCISRGFRYSSF